MEDYYIVFGRLQRTNLTLNAKRSKGSRANGRKMAGKKDGREAQLSWKGRGGGEGEDVSAMGMRMVGRKDDFFFNGWLVEKLREGKQKM